MGDWLTNFSEQVRGLPPARLFTLAATAAGSLAFFLWLAVAMNAPDERVLYRNLSDDEAARVIEGLEAEKIAYSFGEGGTAIYVPAAQLYDARIRLAGKGLPSGGMTGFEIFDRTGFGVTDFVNRVNYQRALQGELARSIEQLEAVERARVQIAVPERSGYLSDRDREAGASVVVRLRSGLELEPAQARGIVHLVASSVEGLETSRVTLVDNRGRMLAPDADGAGGPAPTGALRHQTRLEKELTHRIEAILEPTLGPGRVVAHVAAQLDWTQTELTEESFDPDSQVARSEELIEEITSDGASGASGVPGIASNSPDIPGGGAVGGSRNSSSRTSETINYEISKTVRHTVEPVGTIRQLDVAVLVDGVPNEEGSFEAWDSTALGNFEELAKRAVGFSIERGDQFTITNAPFRSFDAVEPEGRFLDPQLVVLASSLLRLVGVVVAILLFAKLVVKPLAERVGAGAAAHLPARASDLELQLSGAGAGGAEAATPALEEPAPAPMLMPAAGDEAVKALRAWLSER